MKTPLSACATSSLSRGFPFLLSIVSIVLRPISSVPIPTSAQNATFSISHAAINHGNPNLYCTPPPAHWSSIATFFLANLVAYAATVKVWPGEQPLDVLLAMAVALLLPNAGIVRGMQSIFQAAVFAGTDIKIAHKARASCVKVRVTGWEPRPQDKVISVRSKLLGELSTGRKDESISGPGNGVKKESNPKKSSQLPTTILLDRDNLESYFTPSSKWSDLGGCQVHGICELPTGYALCTLRPGISIYEIGEATARTLPSGPISQGGRVIDGRALSGSTPNARALAVGMRNQNETFLQTANQEPLPSFKLGYNLNIPKALIAIFQIFYASSRCTGPEAIKSRHMAMPPLARQSSHT